MIAPTGMVHQIPPRRERRKAENRRALAVSRQPHLDNRPGRTDAQSPKSVIPGEAKESPGEMLRFGTAFREIAAPRWGSQ